MIFNLTLNYSSVMSNVDMIQTLIFVFQNLVYEKIIKDLEKTITDKDQKIDELLKTNSSLKKIQDMIHNISAGKQSA